MNYNFDEYLNTVRRYIDNKKLHTPICAELESHLQDSADFYAEIGYDEETASRKALEDMGEPAIVGENLAKLHKLSTRQNILLTLFFVFSALKIIDLVIYFGMILGISDSFFIELLFTRASGFYLLSEFLVFICLIVFGFTLSLYTKRSSPIWMSAFITLLEIFPIYYSGFITYVLMRRKLNVYLYEISAFDGTRPFELSFYIIPAIIAVLVLSVLIFCYASVIKAIDNPFNDSRKIKKAATVVISAILFASITLYAGVYLYVDKRDKAQFEAHARVVSDVCDLCLEDVTMTGDDFDKIKNKFSYLDFNTVNPEEINNTYTHCDTVLFAHTGPSATIISGLYLGKSASGELYLETYTSSVGLDMKLSPFILLNIFTFDSRWEASSETVDSMISMFGSDYYTVGYLKEGDSIDCYLNKVKESSSHIRYKYSEIPDYPSEFDEEYYTQLVEVTAFGFSSFYIDLQDDKFHSADVILD